MKDKKPMLINKELDIKLYDIDGMGYVNNIVYVRWFADLRHAFLQKYFPIDQMLKHKISPVLIRTEIDYLKPLTIHDKPASRCWMKEMKQTKWVMEFEIYQGDTIHSKGIQIGCFLDLVRKKPEKIPDNISKIFNNQK